MDEGVLAQSGRGYRRIALVAPVALWLALATLERVAMEQSMSVPPPRAPNRA